MQIQQLSSVVVQPGLVWFVPVNKFSVMSGQSQHFLGFNQYYGKLMESLKCQSQGEAEVGIEPKTSSSGVLYFTTMPPRFSQLRLC